jgi:uncharacterized protein with GYD domain
MLCLLFGRLRGKTAVEFAQRAIWNSFEPQPTKEKVMATYVGLIQFADQGIRNIKDTVKRGDAAMAEAEKMGMKVVEEFWTMGAYDAVVVFDAPDDETMSAFMLKIGSLGNVKSHTMRAFRRNEMEKILAKIK